MSSTFEDLSRRAGDLVAGGRESGVPIRAVGGVAIWTRLPERLRPAYEGVRAEPKDLDLVAPEGSPSATIKQVFVARGYVPDERLIAWRGDRRHQYFEMNGSGEPRLEIDVFLGPPPACHKFDLPESGFAGEGLALSPTELLLQKLQIVESTEKDLFDVAFLLLAAEPEIDTGRVAELMSKDWGFHHTTEINLGKVRELAAGRLEAEQAEQVGAAVERLSQAIEAAPKSRRWKMRAKVGTKVQWYEPVEELDR